MSHILTKSNAQYHARCWAENKSRDEIKAEMQRCELKARTHNYQWNEVGSAQWDWDRFDELAKILQEKAIDYNTKG